MAYEKINWTSTTPINITNLRKMEDGIEQNSKKFDYSTEEQVIGTWIDGKPLYRKVIYANSIDCTEEGFKYVAHGISNLKQAPKLTYAIEHDGHMETYNNVINALSATPENIRLYVKAWGVIKNWYFTIEYTKTTD